MVLSLRLRPPAVICTSVDLRWDVHAMNAEAAVLAKWYASHPVVRRLWAVEEIELIRIVVTLEPTTDDDDTQPAWLANSWTWAQDLRLRMNRVVHLEMINHPSHIEAMLDRHSALITELSWRDPTIAAD